MDAKHVAYTDKEKVLLAALIKDNNVVENKQTDASTLQEKQRAWERITKEYNAQPDVSTRRSIGQLKKLWNNMKQRLRKAHTAEKHARLQTGGGPYIEIITEDDPVAKAVEIAAPHVDVQLENAWDSTAVFEVQNAEIHWLDEGPNTSTQFLEKASTNSKLEATASTSTEILGASSTNVHVTKITGPVLETEESRSGGTKTTPKARNQEKRGVKRRRCSTLDKREQFWHQVQEESNLRLKKANEMATKKDELIAVKLETAKIKLKVAKLQEAVEAENLIRAKVLRQTAELEHQIKKK